MAQYREVVCSVFGIRPESLERSRGDDWIRGVLRNPESRGV